MIPDPLLSDIQKKRCLLFIGAGFSQNADVPSGTILSWSKLTDLLSRDIKETSNDPLEIVSIYAKEFGKPNLVKKLSELLHVHDAIPGDVHTKLAQNEYFDTIITTNFDFLLERAFDQTKRSITLIRDDKNISLYSPCTGTNIIKIHGDFQKMSELVITKEDYEKFYETHPVLAINLAAWFTTRTPFFIGYSMNDPHFLEIRKFLKNILKQFLNPWFVLKFDATPEEIEKCKKDSIIVVNLNTKNQTRKEALSEFFSQVQDYISMKELAENIQYLPHEKHSKSSKSYDNKTYNMTVGLFSRLETDLRRILKNIGHDVLPETSFGHLLQSVIKSGILGKSDIPDVVKILDLRNQIVHEQYVPTIEGNRLG